MTDSKTKGSIRRKRRSRRVNPYKKSSVRSSMKFNEMAYRTQFGLSTISSDAKGVIGYFVAPTIANSSEYSVLQSLFTEVKLISCMVRFCPLQVTTGTINAARIVVGTNMAANANTAVNPTLLSQVQNTTHVVNFSSATPTIIYYRMVVPRRLEYSLFNADAPATPTPWAGSPGVVLIFGNGFTVSTAYFDVDVMVVYHLRGRT